MHSADFADIPGTVLFDAQQARKGYGLNQFCMSLMKAANRERFKADEDAFLVKIAATDGISVQQMVGRMTGMDEADYRDMMLRGGRPIEGNRYRHEWSQNPTQGN